MLLRLRGVALPRLQSMLVPGAIGTLIIAAALISRYPEFDDPLVFGIEVAIGIALTLLPFSYSGKSEQAHKSQLKELYSIARHKEESEQTRKTHTTSILYDSINSLMDDFNSLIKMGDRCAVTGKPEWPQLRADLLARHAAAARSANTLVKTIASADYIDDQIYGDIAAAARHLRGGVSIDDRQKTVDTAQYRAALDLLGPLLPRLRRRSGLAAVRMPGAPGPARPPAPPGRLGLRLDRDAYSPGAAICVTVEADGQFPGETVTITILDGCLAERDEKIETAPVPKPNRRAVLVTDMSTKGLSAGRTYTARAVCGGHAAEATFAVDHTSPVMEIDRLTCMMGDDIVVTVTDPAANTSRIKNKLTRGTKKPRLVIVSPHGRIDGYRLRETGPSTGTFRGRLRCLGVRGDGTVRGDMVSGKYVDRTGGRGSEDGAIACGPNQTIRIRYTSKSGEATAAVLVGGLDAIVELDRREYTCLDRVEICIAPSGFALGGDSRPAAAGDDRRDCWLTVSTGEGRLGGYRLVESEPGSGTFMGAVSLTGLATMEGRKNSAVLERGRTGGAGPRGGMLACGPQDELKVSLESAFGRTVHRTAPVRWRIGTIRFSKAAYAPGEEITVSVMDPDMSHWDGRQSRFSIRAWSDSDRKGIPVTVRETGRESGVFEGRFGTSPDGSLAEGPTLEAKEGDTIGAEYTDETLPHPYAQNDSIAVTASATITTKKRLPSPLARLVIDDMRIRDRKTGGPTLVAGSSVEVEVMVKNPERETAFTAILQVSGLDGTTAKILHQPLIARLNGYTTHAFSWTPDRPGTYTATVFLWKGMDDPVAYSLPATREVQVLDLAAANMHSEDELDGPLPAAGGGDGSGSRPATDDREIGQVGPRRRREQR